MNPLHSLIKSELFYSVQVLVMKISTGFSTLLESFLNCSATMRCSFPRYSESMGWNVRCMQLNLALTVHIQVVYFCFSLPQHELQWALARRRLNLAGPQQLSMTITELGPASGKRVYAIIIYGNLFMSLYTSKLFVDTYNKLPRLL